MTDAVERLRAFVAADDFGLTAIHYDDARAILAHIDALTAERDAAVQSAKAMMEDKHKEAAEAKLWFNRAQQWKTAAADERATIVAWLRGKKPWGYMTSEGACGDYIEAGEHLKEPG